MQRHRRGAAAFDRRIAALSDLSRSVDLAQLIHTRRQAEMRGTRFGLPKISLSLVFANRGFFSDLIPKG